MHEDLKVIDRLQQELGFQLEEGTEGDLYEHGKNKRFVRNEDGQVTHVKISNASLENLTPLAKLRSLKALTDLRLSGNQISEVGALSSLKALTVLNLGGNQISEVGALSSLKALTVLDLGGNQISEVGALSSLKALTYLDLGGNQISEVGALSSLKALTRLWLSDNQISEVGALSSLKGLTNLWLSDNQISEVGALSSLKGLTYLDLGGNQISEVGALSSLKALTDLDLRGNQISEVGALSSLKALTRLWLSDNQISEVGALSSLKALIVLDLGGNHISEVGALSSLKAMTHLWLSGNQISELAPIQDLKQLDWLNVENNPLKLLDLSPDFAASIIKFDFTAENLSEVPPSIIEQGVRAICSYSVERARAPQRWVSKLVVVGQGGTGKTSLLRRLQGLPFRAQEDTTHGIQLERLGLSHPEREVAMTLFTWDFGGQEIYHATHQFFLTEGALVLLTWNARLGFAQGNVEYWLENIRSRAPKAPILLVATHVDQRRPDIPLADLRIRFPTLLGQVAFSSKEDTGLEELRAAIARHATGLPLMGERWPESWLKAANHLCAQAQATPYLKRHQLHALLKEAGLANAEVHLFLARWLHELGEILWFVDDPELADLAILDPQWVTRAISRVLESEEVAEQRGLLTRAHLTALWHDIDPAVHGHLLNLMERFDLSYLTDPHGADPRQSLVVELLPFEPPAYEPRWETRRDERSICLQLHLKTSLPPGIPTWFIARQHRFSLDLHWRHGTLLADRQNRRLGLIKVSPERRTVLLETRGPNPWPFFSELRDALEVTLDRYPGLQMERRIPCPCSKRPCAHYYLLEHVERAEAEGVPEFMCNISFERIQVNQLLYGLATREARDGARRHQVQAVTPAQVERLVYGQNLMLEKLDQITRQNEEQTAVTLELAAYISRQFLRQFNAFQSREESRVPNVFSLRPTGGAWLPKKLGGQKVALQLYCQFPGVWHPTEQGGCYSFTLDPAWLTAARPVLTELNKVFKLLMPALVPALGLAGGHTIETDIKLLDGLCKGFDQWRQQDTQPREAEALHGARRAGGADLRALRTLLEGLDKEKNWGGLRPTYTPEGEVLWLCEDHFACFQGGPRES